MANRDGESKWNTTGEEASFAKVILFASAWIACNLILALVNKWLFQYEHFIFPIFIILTGVYTTFLLSSMCVFWFKFEEFPTTKLIRDNMYFLIFLSLSHGLALALENVAIEKTSISFNQIIKATTPILTLAFGYFVEKKRYYPAALFATFVITLGAILATYKVPGFSAIGLFTSLASEFFGVAKSIVSAILLRQGIKPMSMIVLISLPASLSILPMYLSYEHASLLEFMETNHHALFDLSFVLGINWFAVFYNLVTLYLLGFTSAHYFNVITNVKVVLLIVVSMYLFHVRVTSLNAFGIVVSTIGFCGYTYLRFTNREEIPPVSKSSHVPPDECNINSENP